MIRDVRLVNWKAFDDLHVSFEPRATFVLSRNGIGKTSLLQGIFFALIGTSVLRLDARHLARDPSRSVRAEIVLEFEPVPGDNAPRAAVALSRELVVSNSKREAVEERSELRVVEGPDSLRDWCASRPADDALRWLLQRYWNVEAEMIYRLAYLPEGAVWEQTTERAFKLRAHLEQLFGVDRLGALETAAENARRRAVSEASRMRSVTRRAVEVRERLEEAVVLAEGREGKLQAELTEIERRLREKRATLEACAGWEDYRRASQEVEAQWTSVREELGIVGQVEDKGDPIRWLLAQIDEAISQKRQAVERARQVIANAHAVASLARESIDGLEADTCPICLRPMDSVTATHARAEHQQRILAAEEDGRAAQGQMDEGLRIISRLENVRIRTMNLNPPAPPSMGDPADASMSEGAGALRMSVDELSERKEAQHGQLGELRGELRQLRQQLSEADAADAQYREQVILHRQEAIARLVRLAFEAVREAVTSKFVEPVAEQLSRHWKAIWSGGERLGLDPHGGLFLDLPGGRRIPYGSFSGAQKAVALLVLRILALQLTTTSRWLVTDEPMEHLDPRNRRLVASLFYSLAMSGALKQVIATTYEEGLVRSLQERDRLRALGLGVIGPRGRALDAQDVEDRRHGKAMDVVYLDAPNGIGHDSS